MHITTSISTVLTILIYLAVAQLMQAQAMPDANLDWPISGANGVVASEADVLESVLVRLEAHHECDRGFIRHFVFRHTFPNDTKNTRLLWRSRPSTVGHGTQCKEALVKLLRSLSWSPYTQLRVPQIHIPGALIFEIDLRELQWTPATWDRILSEYPYAIKPQGVQYETLVEMSGSKVPFVRGDWFIFAASRPPLYHDILGLPITQRGLEEMLGVCVPESIHLGMAHRCGFKKSGVSKSNRLVEYHKTRFGGLWISYDFSGNDGRRNLLTHPIGPAWNDNDNNDNAFKHDGGELIFTLPGGMQAYMLVDGAGNRLDFAPTNIVVDNSPSSASPVIINGVSCMGCHFEGIKALPADDIRTHVESASDSFSRDEVEAVRTIHRSKEEMDALVKVWSQVFASACESFGGPGGCAVIQRISNLYEAELSAPMAAAEVGLVYEEFRKRLTDSSSELKRALAGLENESGKIHREAFIEIFPHLVVEWRLGEMQSFLGSKDTSDFRLALKPEIGAEPVRSEVTRTNHSPLKFTSTFWKPVGAVVLLISFPAIAIIFVNRVRLEAKERAKN